MQKLGNPIPLFLDANGTLLDSGQIYVGIENGDPQISPIVAYWDAAMTQVAAQPLRTLGGRIVNGGTPSNVFVEEDDYSMRIFDAFDVLVDYSPSVFLSGVAYQPLDTDLTAISQLSTTPFGRALLTVADQAGLVVATGITPFTGGVVSSNITRQGGGAAPYWADAAMTGARKFDPLPTGSADPTSQPGDEAYYY